MATNEGFKYANWISVPLPGGEDDETVNGDPVLIVGETGTGFIGVAQEVGGQTLTYTVGSSVVTDVGRGNSLEPGWASVALAGAFWFDLGEPTEIGDRVNITAGGGTSPAVLAVAAGGKLFGYVIGHDLSDPQRALVRLVQS